MMPALPTTPNQSTPEATTAKPPTGLLILITPLLMPFIMFIRVCSYVLARIAKETEAIYWLPAEGCALKAKERRRKSLN
jgi:hypothetical protein